MPHWSDAIDLSLAINQRLSDDRLSNQNIIIDVKRCDLIHPDVNGNKWYKLKYNIEHAIAKGFDTLLTFGGAYSNHIHATAAAGKLAGLKTIGIIRGEAPAELNPTLNFAQTCGMRLEYITRLAYAEKETEDFKAWLHDEYGAFHLVPEGGSNFLGINGCMELLSDFDRENYDVICCACGTGATMSGVALSLGKNQRLLGFPVFKSGEFMRDEVLKHLRYFLMDESAAQDVFASCDLMTSYHFGGYAKWNEELISFIQEIKQKHSLPLDQVYTGKLLYGVMDLVQQNYWTPGTNILVIHSGGLQGRISELL
jgi:1-aminocyclopropane-1-carboxylate deaminase